MQKLLLLVASLLVLGSAQASEVFVTKDAQGRPIYTDRPESLPAQKVNVATKQTDTVEVQRQYDERMKSYAEADQAKAEASKQAAEGKQAKELSAADKAKRCLDARARYEQVMTAQRLYEPGATEGERRYLDDKEIDLAREHSKKVMDEFCAGP
jgi:multidrug efflux pump subunit AcrA (membrane-fusion protein)